ncbi:MAG: aminopeptidase [Ruminococcaceae bacterium]|jgi:aminopeptidase|nr:aminopeptidase [Oscillospiraceae bacterium]
MEEKLREYARLLIEVGLGLREGQTLLIEAPVECAPFVRLCASAAYDARCREVLVSWRDDALMRERYLHAQDDVFDEHSAWHTSMLNDLADADAAYLSFSARDPEVLRGVDPTRFRRSQIASKKALAPFYDAVLKGGLPWCIASMPIPSWAKKVFPELPQREAMSMLWNAILTSMRVTGDGKATERWNEHLSTQEERRKKLNDMRFKSIHYSNSLGTDLTVELPEDHVWRAGRAETAGHQRFVPNMPAESIFTAPRRDGVNGIVFSSQPMLLNGVIVDKVRFILKDGKIVSSFAERGRDVLDAPLETDENACRFGEISLVPFDSPVSRQGLLFYNMLFDENARSHIALGRSNPECIDGGERMTDEELVAHGLNHSVLHADFVIGTHDLAITGTTADGCEVPIQQDGLFCL